MMHKVVHISVNCLATRHIHNNILIYTKLCMYNPTDYKIHENPMMTNFNFKYLHKKQPLYADII